MAIISPTFANDSARRIFRRTDIQITQPAVEQREHVAGIDRAHREIDAGNQLHGTVKPPLLRDPIE